jgi:hypothetical protein
LDLLILNFNFRKIFICFIETLDTIFSIWAFHLASVLNVTLVYIRPIFEYASEVWDNCGSVNASKLERLQLEAARIVTDLPVFANSTFLMDKSKLFHCLMVDGMYESFVMESLQNGMIMSSPFLSWYTVETPIV